MNPIMQEYFRQKLISWRRTVTKSEPDTIQNTLQSTELQKPDIADRASAETDHALELRTRDRERKLISKSMKLCYGLTMTLTGIVKKPANHHGWKAGCSPNCDTVFGSSRAP